MFLLVVKVNVSAPLASGAMTVFTAGLKLVIVGGAESITAEVSAPLARNDTRESVGKLVTLPLWSMTRTRTRV